MAKRTPTFKKRRRPCLGVVGPAAGRELTSKFTVGLYHITQVIFAKKGVSPARPGCPQSSSEVYPVARSRGYLLVSQHSGNFG
jgi:hypothetical protein